MPRAGWFATVVALTVCLGGPTIGRGAEPDGGSAQAAGRRFDAQIAPLLAARCLECHNALDTKGGLDLTQQAATLAGGDSGPALVAGNADESLLWQRIRDDEMPPKHPLALAEKALVREWIASGASWGRTPIDRLRYTTSTRAGYDWWSLQPVERTAPPSVRGSSWPRGAIDHFVFAKLEAAGLAPPRRPIAARSFAGCRLI